MPSFADLVDRCHNTVLEATAHQDIPFGLVVDALRPERVPGRNPLFQTSLSLHPPGATFGGLDNIDRVSAIYAPNLTHCRPGETRPNSIQSWTRRFNGFDRFAFLIPRVDRRKGNSPLRHRVSPRRSQVGPCVNPIPGVRAYERRPPPTSGLRVQLRTDRGPVDAA
jgi:hypothetical protein